jgi:hypothetical protein
MMDPTRSREIPSCSVIDLTEIRRSSKDSVLRHREVVRATDLSTPPHTYSYRMRRVALPNFIFILVQMPGQLAAGFVTA